MNIHKINILFFCLLLGAMLILNILFFDNRDFSSAENRRLAEMPVFSMNNYFSGEYTDSIDTYLSDRFMFRDNITTLTASIEKYRGYELEDEITIVQTAGFNDDLVTEIDNPIEDKEPLDQVTNPPVNNETDTIEDNANDQSDSASGPKMKEITFDNDDTANIILLKDRGFTAYKKNEDSIKEYALGMNELSQLNESINLSLLIVPSQAYFVDDKYKKYTDDQYDAVNILRESLESDINLIDVFGYLYMHKDENIYFRTDHHWTGLGAYYAYTQLCAEMQLPTVDLDTYEQSTVTNFLGSIYNMSQHEDLKDKPDEFIVYKPNIDLKYYIEDTGEEFDSIVKHTFEDMEYKYNAFLFKDYGLSRIVTEIKNGKNILIIKDSYGNAIIPFLVNHYEKIVMIDPRRYEQPLLDLIEEEEIEDVLIVNSAQILSKSTYIQKLRELLR